MRWEECGLAPSLKVITPPQPWGWPLYLWLLTVQLGSLHLFFLLRSTAVPVSYMCGGRLPGPSSKGGKKPALTLNSTRNCVYSAWCKLLAAPSLFPLHHPVSAVRCSRAVWCSRGWVPLFASLLSSLSCPYSIDRDFVLTRVGIQHCWN